jgi:hypothetical protein
MRVARRVAFGFTGLCLLLAVVTMLGSTTLTFTAGSTSTTTDCGSAAFPRSMNDLRNTDAAANCVGQTPASLALYAVLLACLGLAIIAVTSRASMNSRAEDDHATQDPARAGTSP